METVSNLVIIGGPVTCHNQARSRRYHLKTPCSANGDLFLVDLFCNRTLPR